MMDSSRLRRWMPHVWVILPPIAAVVIGYVLWTLLMIILNMKIPPWPSRLVHAS